MRSIAIRNFTLNYRTLNSMKERLVRVLLGFWLLLNLILLAWGWGIRGYFLYQYVEWDSYVHEIFGFTEAGSRVDTPTEELFPVTDFDIQYYDITEFMLFGLCPILIYFAHKYVKG